MWLWRIIIRHTNAESLNIDRSGKKESSSNMGAVEERIKYQQVSRISNVDRKPNRTDWEKLPDD